jgi:TonB-dependent SusC/RagA subfamily outer membrane receptor
MKYIVVILFVALSTAALAQESEKQYKLNPDSLTTPFTIRPHIKANDPLYVLDEKEISYEELQNLDPNKLESIKVLKDSASTAPYGKKGINGVVLLYSKPRKKD